MLFTAIRGDFYREFIVSNVAVDVVADYAKGFHFSHNKDHFASTHYCGNIFRSSAILNPLGIGLKFASFPSVGEIGKL